jgi:hypothetical protein
MVRPNFEEWLDSTDYNTARKAELRLANELNAGQPPPRHVCRKVKNFIKLEEYPNYKHARLINSRHDRFKAWSGPFFKKIEEQIYDVESNIRFIKHIPVQDRPALLRALPKGMRCYSTDFTAYEKHFTAELMHHCELILYEYMLPCLGPQGMHCLKQTLTGINHISSRNGFSAKVKARRMSGEMCTSLGNGFTNMMLALYLAEKKGGVIHGFVEGDDGIFVTNVELSAEDYKELGFEIKIVSEASPCEASFCGMIFADSGEIIRNPREFVSKFAWTGSCLEGGIKVKRELLRAKALSACYETPQCPIVGAIARYALQETRGVKPRFVYDGYHKVTDVIRDERNVAAFKPSSDTRVLFERKFHISIADQLNIERLCSQGKFDVAAQLMPPPADVLHYVTRYVA